MPPPPPPPSPTAVARVTPTADTSAISGSHTPPPPGPPPSGPRPAAFHTASATVEWAAQRADVVDLAAAPRAASEAAVGRHEGPVDSTRGGGCGVRAGRRSAGHLVDRSSRTMRSRWVWTTHRREHHDRDQRAGDPDGHRGRQGRPTENPDSFEPKLIAALPRGYDDGVCEASAARRRQARWPPSTAVRHRPRAARRTPGIHCSPIRWRSTRPSTSPSPRTPSWCSARTARSIHRRRGTSPKPRTRSRARIACGVFNGNQDVTWTVNADLLIGDAQGPNLEDLHNWWLKFA